MLTKPRFVAACFIAYVITASTPAHAQFDRILENTIRRGINDALGGNNQRRGNNNRNGNGNVETRPRSTSVPGESGRNNPGDRYVPNPGWGIPPRGGNPPRVVNPPPRIVNPPQHVYPPGNVVYPPGTYPPGNTTYPGQIIDGGQIIHEGHVIHDGQIIHNPGITYQDNTNVSEPPILSELPNQEQFRIACPKSESGTFNYKLQSSERNMSLSLNPGYRHTLKENVIWTIRYEGQGGTQTYRLRGGKDYTLRNRNGYWQIYTIPKDSPAEPPTFSGNS